MARQALPWLARVVLETGPLSTFLYHGLVERGVSVECICAPCKGVLAARLIESDVHDAEGLAQLARAGLVQAGPREGFGAAYRRAVLRARDQLMTTRVAMANQSRGVLKLFGLRMGAARTPCKRQERLTALYQQPPYLE